MTTNAFVLTKEIEQLTPEERRLHLENVCASLSLDPKAGLLKYSMMDRGDGSGGRHLVLYATKGATDKLRDIHGVDVIEMVDKVIGGAIVYTAKGKNKAGRIDIAVGAASIENKHGEALAKAFATAQTRASRRLTLQFSGSGLLDESEVSDGTTSIVDAPVPLSEIGQPVTASAEAGVDITGLSVKLPPSPKTVVPEPDEPERIQTTRIPNPAAGLKPISVTAGPGNAKVTETTPSAPAVEPAASEEAPKTRRKRRTKAEMEAARATEQDPKQPQTAATAAEAPLAPSASSAVTESVTEVPVQAPIAPVPTPAPASEPVAKATVPVIGDKPTAEQMQVYVDRLKKYSDEILVNGGILPGQGMGPRRKLREFMKIINAGSDLVDLTNPQWENSFRYLDETVAQKGVKGLIEIIEYNLDQVANATS